MEKQPVIVVHGGAGERQYTYELRKAIHDGICRAARKGYEVLQQGTALDAVMEAVSVLEDDGDFNAGYGSKLRSNKEINMDAMLMNGQNLQCGAVISVSNIANPIRLARLVMDKSEHCILGAPYVNEFAKDNGVSFVTTEELTVPDRVQEYDMALKEHDTVGAVALDRYGNLACATSTGGLTLACPGRIGDSSLPGCGGYADNTLGACSTTGVGEKILRVTMAARVMHYLELGQSSQEAASNSVQYLVDRVDGFGGVTVLDKNGEIGLSCSHGYLIWASIKDNVMKYGLNTDKVECEHL